MVFNIIIQFLSFILQIWVYPTHNNAPDLYSEHKGRFFRYNNSISIYILQFITKDSAIKEKAINNIK
jgi:hypothetical protein